MHYVSSVDYVSSHENLSTMRAKLFYAVLHPQRLAQEILTNEKNPGVSLEGFVCLGKGARLETSQDLLPGENLDYPFLLWSALF